nr:GNAT family N-acetyltransferase [Bacteroidota bacterium]
MVGFINIEKGLTLNKIGSQDATPVFELIDKDRKNLRKWLPFVDMTISPENTTTFINQLQKACSREYVFTIRYKDAIVGLIGFKDIDKVNMKLEIGYWIVSEFEGLGIVTKCCKAIIDIAFTKMKMNRVQIKCGVGNVRSSNIPKRLNFTFEGIERASEKHRIKYIDLEVYSRLRRDAEEVGSRK